MRTKNFLFIAKIVLESLTSTALLVTLTRLATIHNSHPDSHAYYGHAPPVVLVQDGELERR